MTSKSLKPSGPQLPHGPRQPTSGDQGSKAPASLGPLKLGVCSPSCYQQRPPMACFTLSHPEGQVGLGHRLLIPGAEARPFCHGGGHR